MTYLTAEIDAYLLPEKKDSSLKMHFDFIASIR